MLRALLRCFLSYTPLRTQIAAIKNASIPQFFIFEGAPRNIQNLKELMKLVELDQIKYELTDKAQNLKELGESL